jgi:hypothetical protein
MYLPNESALHQTARKGTENGTREPKNGDQGFACAVEWTRLCRQVQKSGPHEPAVRCASLATLTLLMRDEGSTAQDASSGAASPFHTRTRSTSLRRAVTSSVNPFDATVSPSRAGVNCCASALKVIRETITSNAVHAKRSADRNMILLGSGNLGRALRGAIDISRSLLTRIQ